MAATLTSLTDRVEAFLMDSGNSIWDTGTIAEAIRQTLHEYSRVWPQQAVGTVTMGSDTREVDVSALTGLLGVRRVWLDYDSSNPENPPRWASHFELWPGSILYVGDIEPKNNDVLRIFYTVMQTLNGLDSETVTSIPLDHESLIVIGAAGYAAFSRSVDLAETAGVSAVSTPNLAALGSRLLRFFREELYDLREQNQSSGAGGPIRGGGWDSLV